MLERLRVFCHVGYSCAHGSTTSGLLIGWVIADDLISFLQLADGVDDATWEHHLHEGDYAQWFRESIKDDVLAATAERIADLPNVSAQESRQLIRTAVATPPPLYFQQMAV